MSAELVSLQRVLTRLGIAADTDEAADALLTLRAVSAEVRATTHRDFEGVSTVYDEVVDAGGQYTALLPHVPVAEVFSIARVYSDGTEESIYVPNDVSHDGALSWSTTTAAAVAIGDTNVKVTSVDDIAVGDLMQIAADEVVRVTAVGTAGAAGSGLTIEPAAKFVNVSGVAVKHVSGSIAWHLTDAERGKVEFGSNRRLLRVVWRVTGAVPLDLQDAVVDWVEQKHATRGKSAGMTGYTTGADSESYDATMVGQPTPNIARVLARYWRSTRNGVV